MFIMNENKTERLNITLPTNTVKLIDRVWRKKHFKSRSAFLNEAARRYATRLNKATLIRQLRSGYKANVINDADLVNEWDNASNDIVLDFTDKDE